MTSFNDENQISESAGRLVDFYIGSSLQHFQIPENLLLRQCDFFKKVLGTNVSQHPSEFEFREVDESTFQLFVDWITDSERLPSLGDEADLTEMFELYMLASRKFCVPDLTVSVTAAVKRFYGQTATYPSLRRVQYIRANTQMNDSLRCVLVGMTARNLTLGKESDMPAHWKKAVLREGDLGWELLNAVRGWKLEDQSVPDVREVPNKNVTGVVVNPAASGPGPTSDAVTDGVPDVTRELLSGQEDR